MLARKYESNGNPACVSAGTGDLGGISYGTYQLSSNAGSLQSFLAFAREYEDKALANYGTVLSNLPINSEAFISLWKDLGTIDPEGFGKLQDEYAKAQYYDKACALLTDACYQADKHTEAMQAVIMSRAVQYGAGNMVELFTEAVNRLGHPNLSYVDDAYFDRQMIDAIYGFLIDECEAAYGCCRPTGLYHSPKDWVNGSKDVVYGLENRFQHERQDAMDMLVASKE